MEFILIAIAVAANILVIKRKLELRRFEDAALDTTLLVIVTIVFGDSYAGLVVGTIASAIISVSLWLNPPTFLTKTDDKPSFFDEFKRRARRKY